VNNFCLRRQPVVLAGGKKANPSKSSTRTGRFVAACRNLRKRVTSLQILFHWTRGMLGGCRLSGLPSNKDGRWRCKWRRRDLPSRAVTRTTSGGGAQQRACILVLFSLKQHLYKSGQLNSGLVLNFLLRLYKESRLKNESCSGAQIDGQAVQSAPPVIKG
jgi:hypothetical protein